MISVSLSVYFSSDELAKHTLKKLFVLFSSSDSLLVCLLQSQLKRGVGVYKVFNSSDY